MKTLSRYVRLGDTPVVSLVAYKTTADVVSKAVTLIITVAAARVLPAADFGVLALAMTTGWLLSVASDAGLPLFLAKQVSRGVAAHEPLPFQAVTRLIRLRGAFGTVAAAAGIFIAFALAPGSAVAAFCVIVLAQLLNAILETLSHAYRGLGRSDIESGLMLVQRVVTVAAAIAVLTLWPSLLALSLALAIPPAIALVASLQIAGRVFPRDLSPVRPHVLSTTQFAQEVAPVGLGILLSALYFRCDVFFIERWQGVEAVGVYNAAFRVVEALRLFPAAVLAVTFPVLCSAYDLRPLRTLSLGFAASGTLLLVVLYAAAPALLGVVYGERFLEAAPALRILALALPLFFVNYALTHQVIAWNGQRAYLAICAAALMTNVIANALLIPTGGMTGAAASTLITELVVSTGCLIALHRTARDPAFLPRATSRGAGSTAGMAGLATFAKATVVRPSFTRRRKPGPSLRVQ